MDVVLFHPNYWTAHGHWDYLHQTPGSKGNWEGIQYHVNPTRRLDADFAVIHQDVSSALRVSCRQGGLVLVTGEEKSIQDYPQEFIDQFNIVVTSRDDLRHANLIRTFYYHPWRVKKTYDELSAMLPLSKTKMLSAVISSLQTLPGQKQRFELMVKLKAYYQEKLDWFSKGQQSFVADKWDGLASYQYSIAIENSRHENYFTEKLSDCFLAFTMPIYSGCPNISNFFDERSFIAISPDRPDDVITAIDLALTSESAKTNALYVGDSRRLVLQKYHFIAALSNTLKDLKTSGVRSSKIIRPQSYFTPGSNSLGKRLSRIFHR